MKCALLLVFASLAFGDTLHLKNGRTAECQIISFSPDAVRITWQNAGKDVPLVDISYIHFSPLPGEEAALAVGVKDGETARLLALWVKKQPLLERPRSNAGEIGLVFAEILTRVITSDRLERALKIYQQIESTDWSMERKGRAQAGRLRILLRQGKIDLVRPEAERLAREASNPRVLIELKHVLAETATTRLKQLEMDHPRWQEEDEIVPQHARLFHEALEGYLFPHVFHGAEEDLAARGLWAAALLQKQSGDYEAAIGSATDLVKLYPSSAEHGAAEVFLKERTPAKKKVSEPTAEKSAEDGDQ